MPATSVVLVAHDPAWAWRATAHADGLRVLGAILREVHHIGSTSVPAIAAKPVIDLLPVVTDLDALDPARDRVEALGYAWRGEYGIAGRRFFTVDGPHGTRGYSVGWKPYVNA